MKSDSMAKNDTEEIDFARKHEEDLRRLRGLRLLDDDCMQKASDYFEASRPESAACKRTAGYQESAGAFGNSGYTGC